MKFFIKNHEVFAYPSSKYDGSTLYDLDAPEIQAILNPPKSNDELFAEEFKARKAVYDKDVYDLTIAMAGIILNDGPTEADKKTQLQALKVQTTNEYNQDIAVLKAKYYG